MEVTMKGKPLKLVGNPPKLGDKAPDCELITMDLKKVQVADYRPAILSCVPSLDTSTCSIQTRRFLQEVERRGVQLVTISMDLPFAQKRWCGAEGAANATVLSDHREAAFGRAFGILIPSLRLLARTVFVVDANGVIRYVQVVPEISEEPDYASALAACK
ncbi:MAG: thiol peroxidase [Parachlamydiales bacterium]